VEKVFGLENLSDYEKEGLQKMMPELMKSIDVGVDYAKQMNAK
jgi:malate dehydrogenase